MNKRAMVMEYIIIFGFVSAISAFFLLNAYKNTSKHTDFVGQAYMESQEELQNANNDIFFIQKAGEYAQYLSLYDFAANGAYHTPRCQTTNDVTLWEDINQKCYPEERELKANFESFLNNNLNTYFEQNTESEFPLNNYRFIFTEKESQIAILGTAAQPITHPSRKALAALENPEYKQRIKAYLSEEENICLADPGHYPEIGTDKTIVEYKGCKKCPSKELKCDIYLYEDYCGLDPCDVHCFWADNKCRSAGTFYTIKPEIKTTLPYNFIKEFEEYSKKAKEIRSSIQNCLLKGSEKPDDKDLAACSGIERLKQSIPDIENYQISPITTDTDYTLLFAIKDSSFQNPYSDEPLTIKFGIRFPDTFPPPATTIKTETIYSDRFMTWENPAEDIRRYYIYYKKIEKTTGASGTAEYPKEPPKEVLQTDNHASPIVKTRKREKIEGLETGDYYFIILAEDKTGSLAVEFIAKRVKITAESH